MQSVISNGQLSFCFNRKSITMYIIYLNYENIGHPATDGHALQSKNQVYKFRCILLQAIGISKLSNLSYSSLPPASPICPMLLLKKETT
jgi:hypothetical protein